jgi:tetratricopeptide (TPR) repeat protein
MPPLVVFAALLGVLTLANRSSVPSSDARGTTSSLARPPTSLDTEGQISQLQSAVRADPSDAGSYALLGDAYYQRARETGDPAYYTRADGSFEAALSRDPANVTAIAGQATLALARHDFRGGLVLAGRAQRLAPQMALPYAPLADAQVELGRYGAAAHTLNLGGALEAMRLAVSAGSGSPEGEAYVLGLQGKLLSDLGRYGAAEHAYREAYAINPGYPPALAGIAGLEAGGRDFGPAIRHYRAVVERLPLPEYAVALGEAEEAAGRIGAARRDYALVGAEVKLLHANGVNTDAPRAGSRSAVAPGGRRRVCARPTPTPGPCTRRGGSDRRAASPTRRCGLAPAIRRSSTTRG